MGTFWVRVLHVVLDQAAQHHHAPILTASTLVSYLALIGNQVRGRHATGRSDSTPPASISSTTESPSLTCGVTVRVMPTFSRSMVWKGFCAPSPPAPVLVKGAGHKGHVLAHRDIGLLVIQGQHDWVWTGCWRWPAPCSALRITAIWKSRHPGSPSPASSPGSARQGAGEVAQTRHHRRSTDSPSLLGGSTALGYMLRAPGVIRVDITAVTSHPHSANSHCRPRSCPSYQLHLHDNGFHQHLRAADIQAMDHRLQRRHLAGASAVMISALVPSSASMVGAVTARACWTAWPPPAPSRRTHILHHPGQHLGRAHEASAYSRYITLTLPLCSRGVSRWAINLRLRGRAPVRHRSPAHCWCGESATSSTSGSAPPLCLASDLFNLSSMRTTSSATA